MYASSEIASAESLTEQPHPLARRVGGSAPSEARYADVITPLRGLGSVVGFERGAVIFRGRDHANAIYRVVSGGVGLSRTVNGRRRIIDFRFAGEFFGAVHRPEYTTDAEATSDCLLLSYRRGIVDTMFDELPHFRRALAALLAGCVQSSGDNADGHTARERIEAFLSSLPDRIPDWSEVDLPLSCHDIADRLDVSPAAVEAVLHERNSVGSRPEISP